MVKRNFDGDDVSENEDDEYLLRSQEVSWTISQGGRTFSYTVKIRISRGLDFETVKKIDATLYFQTKEVGTLRGTILPRPTNIFYEMADASSSELQRLSNMFCDRNGHATRIEGTGMPLEDVHRGGFFHIAMMRVQEDHKGRDVGLHMLHHVLVVLKDDWKLIVLEACPQLERLGFSVDPDPYADTGFTPEQKKRLKDATVTLERHYARMGFQQAGRNTDAFDVWFLTAFNYFQNTALEPSAHWQSKEDVQNLDVYEPPEKHQSQGLDLELQKLIQARAPWPKITALIRKGASVHGSRALFILVANTINGEQQEHISPTLQALAGLGDVNEGNEDGNRLLHMAASSNHSALIRFLISVGANKSLTNENGHTPLDCLESSRQSYADYFATFDLKNSRPMDVIPHLNSGLALMPSDLCSVLIDGWLSPRMLYAFECTVGCVMSGMEDHHMVFKKNKATSLKDCCDYPGMSRIEYIPTAVLQRNSEGLYKSFADGWEIVWTAIMVILSKKKNAPTLSRIRNEIHSGAGYDLRKWSHFVQKGGKIDYAIDALTKITETVVLNGDDGWEYCMHEDDIRALPATPFDKSFDLAKVKCLELTNENFPAQPKGPYRHNIFSSSEDSDDNDY